MLAAEHLGEVADHLIGYFVDQARRSGASWTDTGQCMGVTKQAALLHALLADTNALSVVLLAAQNITLPPPAGDPLALVPFNGPAKKVLELTFPEALRLGHNYIGTEHILLALLECEDADGLLHRLGVDNAKLETDLAGLLQAITTS